MANLICHRDARISMSNGLTAVWIETMCLAGSALAVDRSEIELVVWLAEHDQVRLGSGTVGFDLADMPWTRDRLGSQRLFLFRVAQAVQDKTGWDQLQYRPREDWLFSKVAAFSTMVAGMGSEDVVDSNRQQWLADRDYSELRRCPRHHVFRSFLGCLLCDDEG